MIASFDDLAVLEDDDLIGFHDGRKAMRDYDGRFAFHERGEPLLDILFASGVEGRSGFV